MINKVAVLYKQSIYELSVKHGSPDRTPKVLEAHNENERSKETVLKVLDELGIKSESVVRGSSAIPDCDLIIAVGGDGTFLEASHHIRTPEIGKEAPRLLGVNSCPSSSHGHWCYTTPAKLKETLVAINNKELNPLFLMRLGIQIGTKTVAERVLNEVFIAHKCPAGTTKFELTTGEGCFLFSQNFTSSGVVVGTAAGSTGTLRSMGMKVLDVDQEKWMYCVNMPYRLPGEVPFRNMDFGYLSAARGTALFIKSKIRDMRLWIDGSYVEYPVEKEQTVYIYPDHSLKAFVDRGINRRYMNVDQTAGVGNS